jgi:hypothetical protein
MLSIVSKLDSNNLLVDNLASFLQHPHFLAFSSDGITDPTSYVLLGRIDHDFGAMNGRFSSIDPTRFTFLSWFDVLGANAHAFNNYLAQFGERFQDFADLTFIATGDNLNGVALLDVHPMLNFGFLSCHFLEYLRSQGDDFGKAFVAEFASDRAENASASGITFGVD